MENRVSLVQGDCRAHAFGVAAAGCASVVSDLVALLPEGGLESDSADCHSTLHPKPTPRLPPSVMHRNAGKSERVNATGAVSSKAEQGATFHSMSSSPPPTHTTSTNKSTKITALETRYPTQYTTRHPPPPLSRTLSNPMPTYIIAMILHTCSRFVVTTLPTEDG